MTTLNARLTRRAFLGGAAAFGAAAMVSPKNAFADPTSADVQAQADEARQKLNSMREQLGVASANYNQAVQEHDEAVSKMDECQTKIDDNNAQIDKLQDKLSKRARNMYRDGQTTFLDVILGSNSFDDFAKNWDTLTSLNEKDSEMVEQTKNLRADNEAQKQDYANQADIAQQKVEEADAAQKQAEELVQQYQNEVDSLDSQVAELLAEEELSKAGLDNVEIHLNEWNTHNERAHRGSSVASANTAAMMCAMHDTKVNIMCYYDARIAAGVFGGLFNPDTALPVSTYYSIYAYGKLRALGSRVEVTQSGDKVYCLAATDKTGEKKAIMIANIGEETLVKTDIKADATVRLIDREHLFTEEAIKADEFVLGENQVAFIELDR